MKIELNYPVTPFSVNQKFGENPALYAQFNIKGHNGLDLKAYHGQPVYASHDGMATYEVDENQGDGFIVISNEKFDFEGGPAYAKTIYWHLCSATDPTLKPVIPTDGKSYPVKRGQLLGYADSTGFSTGDHLHFGLKPIMPGEDSNAWYNFAQNNGYAGAIDPLPYMQVPVQDPADKIAVIAAQTQAQGNKSLSEVLYAIAKLIRAWISG